MSNLKPKPDPRSDYEVSQSQFTAPADTIFVAVSISLFVDLQVVEQVAHGDSSLSHTVLFPNMQHIKETCSEEKWSAWMYSIVEEKVNDMKICNSCDKAIIDFYGETTIVEDTQ